jgi:hypothetical protein
MQDLTDQQFYERLGEIKGTPTCSQWAEGFADSIREQIGKGRTLSDRQKVVCLKILKENSQEAQQSLANWEEEYETKFKSLGYKISSYYQAQGGGYYGNVATPVLAGKVPERRAFLKMINNKYAKKVIAEIERKPRFSTDDHIIPNSKFLTGYSATNRMICTRAGSLPHKEIRDSFNVRGGVILGVDEKIVSAAKGAKRYLVLPFGASEVYLVEERYLKIKPKVKKAKVKK